MSLVSPHPLWSTAASSPSKVAMATVQAIFLSGRYRSEALCCHWTSNKSGTCLLSPSCKGIIEDVFHILCVCPALDQTRTKLQTYTSEYAEKVSPEVKLLLCQLCSPSYSYYSKFLMDCSSLPLVISAVQSHGNQVLHHLFNVTRTWIYVIHRERLKLLGRWNVH